ncbi:Uncoordinated protein 58 [Dirofilaria immitis]|nr:Uncoordinated protein 58 [Dirofilaria immitis]
MEDNADREQQLSKLSKIRDTYRKIAEIASDECSVASKQSEFRLQLFQILSKLSSYMEGRDFSLNPDINQLDELVLPKWTAVPSILYALSILTTTGYLSAVPMTKLGQFIAIIYGLVGIPLMVLAAVDIGRFLSDIVLGLYQKYRMMKYKLAKVCGCLEKNYMLYNYWKRMVFVTIKKNDSNERRLPLLVNASILLVFCMLGGVWYTAAGLAVLSMCANLAASELRAVFMKIHYFGRKISWRRQHMLRDKQHGAELSEILKVIIAIREMHPEKAS